MPEIDRSISSSWKVDATGEKVGAQIFDLDGRLGSLKARLIGRALNRSARVKLISLNFRLFALLVGVLCGACTTSATSPPGSVERPEPSPSAGQLPATWTPAITKSATHTQAPTSTIAPTNAPTPSPKMTSLTPGSLWARSRVNDAQLISAGQGWALVGENLLWSDDGGESWRDITPPISDGFYIGDVFFLNADQGWVARSSILAGDLAILPIQIMHTQDGGRAWRENAFEASLPYIANGRLAYLEFIDPMYGWLVVDRTATMNSHAGDLYQSIDSGITWHLKSLPFSGPVHFIAPSIGWTLGSCCTGAPMQLYRTTDGGQTWQQQVIAPDPVEDGYDYHDYGLPVFQNEREGVLAITLRDPSYEVSGVGFYRTSDSGQSWQMEATFHSSGQVPLGAGGSIPVQILGPDHWILALPDALYVTRDAGGTWEELVQAGLPGFHTKLEFVTEDLGWSLVFENNCGEKCLILFKTTDGGKSWNAVKVKN